MSLTLVYGNRPSTKKSLPTFFTPLNGTAKADVFKIIKMYQGLKSLCKFFVGAAILQSLDGTKMAVYEQWKEETDFSALGDPNAHPEVYFLRLTSSDFQHLEFLQMIHIREFSDRIQQHHELLRNLELVVGECNSGLPDAPVKEHAMHLEMFKTQPNKFDRLQAQCIARIKEQLANADSSGLLAYSVHRSLDGTKLAIVGHWQSSKHATIASGQAEDHHCSGKNLLLYTDRTSNIYKCNYLF